MSFTLPNRSVNDFPSDQDLYKALLSKQAVQDKEDAFLRCRGTTINAEQQRSHHHHRCCRHRQETAASQVEEVIDPSLMSEMSICSDELSFTTTTTAAAAAAAADGYDDCCCLDWRLVSTTPDASTIEAEWKRLLALRSYRILDQRESTPVKESLQGLVDLMRTMMNAPYAYITLVDLGRAYILASSSSSSGGDDDGTKQAATLLLQEVPRRKSYAAHVIAANDDDVVVVQDARQDERFCNNSSNLLDDDLAQSTPFYTGVPLIVPEGFKIGALCVRDNKPRPEGITSLQKTMLQQGAQLIVQALVCHRQLVSLLLTQQKQQQQHAATVAMTAHSIVTPLTGLQLSLGMLKDEKDLQLSLSQRECLDTAHSCALEVVRNMSESRLLLLRPPNREDKQESSSSASSSSSSSSSLSMTCFVDNPANVSTTTRKTMPSNKLSHKTTTAPATFTKRLHLQEMAHMLHTVMEAVPKKVPVSVNVNDEASIFTTEVLYVPEELKVEIFQAALSLVTYVSERAIAGSVRFAFVMETSSSSSLSSSSSSSSSSDHDDNVLLMQCCATACEALLEEDNVQKSSSDLPLVIQHLDHLGGAFGIDKKEPEVCYWLRLPIVPPSEEEQDKKEQELPSLVSVNSGIESIVSARAKSSLEEASVETPVEVSATATTMTTTKKKKSALVIDDSVIVRKCMARALSKLDFDKVDVAEDGMIGLCKLRQSKYDVVWCDFLMPHMDGMDCIREFRRWEKIHRPGSRQFIVGMSAHASKKDVETALTLGMDDYSHKPVTLDCIKALSAARVGGRALHQDSGHTSGVEESVQVFKKRRILDQEISNQKACLIAASPAIQSELRECAESGGFDAVVVENGHDALGLLKSRNWIAVFLDCCLPELDGMQCIREFRTWEQLNRVNRQSNIHLICDGYRRRGSLANSSDYCCLDSLVSRSDYCRRDSSECGGDDSASLATLPDGVDGAVGKPIQKAEVQELLQELQDSCKSTARPLNIVMRL